MSNNDYKKKYFVCTKDDNHSCIKAEVFHEVPILLKRDMPIFNPSYEGKLLLWKLSIGEDRFLFTDRRMHILPPSKHLLICDLHGQMLKSPFKKSCLKIIHLI